MTDTKLYSDHRPCGSHAWARTWWTPRACCIFLTSKREKEREGEKESKERGGRERKREEREIRQHINLGTCLKSEQLLIWRRRLETPSLQYFHTTFTRHCNILQAFIFLFVEACFSSLCFNYWQVDAASNSDYKFSYLSRTLIFPLWKKKFESI